MRFSQKTYFMEQGSGVAVKIIKIANNARAGGCKAAKRGNESGSFE